MYAGAKIFTVWKSKIYFLLIFNFDIFLRAGGVYDSKTQKTVTTSPHRSFRSKRRNNTVRTACRLACQACLALLAVSVKGEHGTAQRSGEWTTRIWKNESRRNLTGAEGVFTRVGDIQKAIFVLVLLVQLAHCPARIKVSTLKSRNWCEQSGQLIEKILDIPMYVLKRPINWSFCEVRIKTSYKKWLISAGENDLQWFEKKVFGLKIFVFSSIKELYIISRAASVRSDAHVKATRTFPSHETLCDSESESDCSHWTNLDWGTILSTNKKMARSASRLMRFRMIHMNWAAVMSDGT
jgi:hypothetical protein